MQYSQNEQLELSTPFLNEGNNNRQLLQLDSLQKKQSNHKSIDTPGFQFTLNSGSIDYGSVVQNLFDDGEYVQGNVNKKVEKLQGNPNVFKDFYYNLPVFFPNSILMLIWKSQVGGIVLLYFFVVPITVSFTSEVWVLCQIIQVFTGTQKNIVDGICFALLILDIFLEFLTAFYEHGNLITDKDRIAHQYVRGCFFFDVIGVLAFGIISLIPDGQGRIFLLLFFLKYPALLKIDYLFEEATLLHRALRTIYNVGKIIVILQFCFLLFSCIFYVIGVACVEAGYHSWLLNDGNFGQIYELDTSYHFFFSYYFGLGTMTTTMGYGDITPLNVFECTWCLGGIFFAVFIFQVNVNSLFKIMEEFNVHPIKIFKKRIAINRFLESKQVPLNVQERVRRYLNEHWFEEGTRDLQLEQEVFQELAPDVKEELFYSSYGQFFHKVPFFKQNFSQELLKILSIKIEEISYSQNEIIFEDKAMYSNDDLSFYYIDFGEVLIYANLGSDTPFWIKQLNQSESFGEWSFLTGRPRTASASANQYSRLYKIQRANFLEAIADFPDDYERFWMLRDRLIFSREFQLLKTACWTCDSTDHYASECKQTHYKPSMNKLLTSQNEIQPRTPRYFRMQINKWRTLSNQIYLTQHFGDSTFMKQSQQASIRGSIISDKQPNINNIRQQLSKEATKIFDSLKIKKEQKDFDRPYTFKFYFPKNNFQNMAAFQNFENISKIINVRKSSFLPPAAPKQDPRRSTIFAWQKQY